MCYVPRVMSLASILCAACRALRRYAFLVICCLYLCVWLYCRLLCRAARCHGTAGAVVLLMWSCCGKVLWRVGMWHQTPLRLGHDKNLRIQNLELSAPARALGSWTSLSSSFSSLSLFSSSLTSKLNEVSKKKTILNVSAPRVSHLRSEWGHQMSHRRQTADPPRSCPTTAPPRPADSVWD